MSSLKRGLTGKLLVSMAVASKAAKHTVKTLQIPEALKGFLLLGPKTAAWAAFELPADPPANSAARQEFPALDDYAHLVEPHILQGQPVLLVSARTQPVLELTRWLEDLGGEVAATNALDLALHAITDTPDSWGLLAIFMDGLSDADGIVETLLLLRSIKPDLPIILVSEDFKRNDFGTERMLICDVSLRAPITQETLDLAVAQSISNNRIFAKTR